MKFNHVKRKFNKV